MLEGTAATMRSNSAEGTLTWPVNAKQMPFGPCWTGAMRRISEGECVMAWVVDIETIL
jgi:hypothetical protein